MSVLKPALDADREFRHEGMALAGKYHLYEHEPTGTMLVWERASLGSGDLHRVRRDDPEVLHQLAELDILLALLGNMPTSADVTAMIAWATNRRNRLFFNAQWKSVDIATVKRSKGRHNPYRLGGQTGGGPGF